MSERSIFSFFKVKIERTTRTSNKQSSKMKTILFSLAMLCAISCAVEAQRSPAFGGRRTSPTWPKPNWPRFRREEPRGSIKLDAIQPLSGPNRNPSVDLTYNHRLIDNGKTTLDAFGGANLHNRHVSPQAGLNYEHRFNNDLFIRGQGQVQQGPRGRLEPSFGAGLGWRFRREAMPYEEEEVAEEVH